MTKQKIWLFIDIDGCIMPNAFNNAFYKNDEEKLISIIATYQKIKEQNMQIYPEFIDWCKRISKNRKYEIHSFIFITGRQENVFGYITELQLKPLRNIIDYCVIYFPNFAKHEWEYYRNFKISSIADQLQFSDYHGDVWIFDDMDLDKDFKEKLDYPHKFYLIKEKEDWNRL